METILIAIFCALAVSAVSLIGVATFSFSADNLKKLTNYLLSLAAGAMLGNALLHMLPHALEDSHQEHASLTVALANTATATSPQTDTHLSTSPISIRSGNAHNVAAISFNEEKHNHQELRVFWLLLLGFFTIFGLDLTLLSSGNSQSNDVKPLGYLILFTDALENFMDGLVIGTAFLISIPAGIATTIAIFIHEIPLELGDFAILTHSGFSREKALLLNFASAIVNVIGVVFALILGNMLTDFTSFATPFAAGTLIYMAATGLLPQVRARDTAKQKFLSFSLTMLGVALMALILLLE